MKETVILLPEKECGDLFYLISGDRTSWIRVLPDETVTVDVRKKRLEVRRRFKSDKSLFVSVDTKDVFREAERFDVSG